LSQKHPVDRERSRHITVAPEVTPAGLMLRFPDLEVPDWMQPDMAPRVRARGSLHDLRVDVYCRGRKPGEGDVEAEAHLVAPRSETARVAYPVTVLPDMWRPLKGSDQPDVIPYVLALNCPTRINALAVLRGGGDEAVSALRRTLESWRSLVDPDGSFTVAAETEPVQTPDVDQTAEWVEMSGLDLSETRQNEWDRVLANLPSLESLLIRSELRLNGDLTTDDLERHLERHHVHLRYLAPAQHPDMPEYAARLGHLALSARASDAARSALVELMQALAGAGLIGQAYVAVWQYVDDPEGSTLYEQAAGIIAHEPAAHGWGTRYLRAVADRLWLGPALAARIPDRGALERVAVVTTVGDTLAIERRPEANLRDIELCLEPMLPTDADSAAFWNLFKPLDE
jgi:hypothetical protein